VTQLTPAGALASMLRWAVMAQTTDVMTLAVVAATARYHFCAASSCLHASALPHRAARPRRNRRRSTVLSVSERPPRCSPVSGVLYAHLGVPRVLGHGCLVCVCLPADLEAEVIGVRGKPYSLCSSIQQANHACERSPPKILSLVNASRFRSNASCRRLIGVWHEGTSVRWLS